MSTWESVHLGVCSYLDSAYCLATRHSAHVGLLSTIGSVNSAFCSCLVLSSWKSVQLGVCLLWFCPLWSLATWHYAKVGLCPLLGSVNSGFCSRLALSTWESVQLEGCLLEFCLFWESDHMTFSPSRILSHYWFYQLWIVLTFGSLCTWESVQLGCLSTWNSVHLGVWPHDTLPK